MTQYGLVQHRFRIFLVVATLLGAAAWGGVARAVEQPELRALWPEGAPGALGNEAKDRPQLIIHPAPRDRATGGAIVVLPGGGYGGLAMDHEGQQIADWLNSLGISAFICDYRHRGKGYGHPAPLQDAQRAIRTVRAECQTWNVDPQKIGVLGFSAGGHLASTVATHFDAGNPQSENPVERTSCRPDFAILCYAVIALDEPYTHRGSQRNLLGENPEAELVRSLSNEKQVTPETPPTFLWHTHEDVGVPAENSIYFYLALRKANVPAELHVFEKGRHGVGLGADVPGTAAWPELCAEWLRVRGVLPDEVPSSR